MQLMTKSVLLLMKNVFILKYCFFFVFMLFINLCVRVNTIHSNKKNPPMWKKMPLIRSGSQEVLCCASYRENSIKFVMKLKRHIISDVGKSTKWTHLIVNTINL